MRKLTLVTALVVILSFAAGLARVAVAQSGTEAGITLAPRISSTPQPWVA